MNNNNLNQGNDNNLLVGFYGQDTFCKVYLIMSIGRVKFSFVNRVKKESIDYYMNIEFFEFDFLNRIRSGEFSKKYSSSKQKQINTNSQYADVFWESRKSKKTMIVDGKNQEILTHFVIAPGNRSDLVFTANQGKRKIMVPGDYRDLELLVYRWFTGSLHDEWVDIMKNRFNHNTMVTTYQPQNKENPSKEDNKSVKDNSAQGSKIIVKFVSPVKDMKNGAKVVQAITINDEELYVIFNSESLKEKEITSIKDGESMELFGSQHTDKNGKVRFFVS